MLDTVNLEGFNRFFWSAFFCACAYEQQIYLLVESSSIFENTVESGFNHIACALCIWRCTWSTWCRASSHVAHEKSAECTHPCKFIHVDENGLGRLHTASGQAGHGTMLPVGLSAEGLFYKRYQIFNIDLSYIVRGSLADI